MPRRIMVFAGLAWAFVLAPASLYAKPKIYIAFQWHLHQPIYWPYETVVQTEDAGRFSFDPVQGIQDRSGPYSAWPMDAVEQGTAFAHFGAQVSFTGSLIEDLNSIEAAGRGFSGWKNRWTADRPLQTSLGHRRIDLVNISYHHPVLPLIPEMDRGLQIELHKAALDRAFGTVGGRSQGMFPPETAFAVHIIPALTAQGIAWVLADNIHFDRTRPDYPYTASSNLIPSNPADQRDTTGSVTWVQLTNIWAPSKVSAPWGYQPHWAQYVDPESAQATKIIVVPAARYEGNEDARGGFGAFLYDQVMSQYEAFNTDDAHPMLVVLHHDGDNYGGGSDSYYHGNFGNFVSWLQAQSSRFECTTIQDYLDRFPPDTGDVIHVEPGSWSGADNGDPQFGKWNGDPGADGYSPDRNSWAVITAAANRVHTAEAISPHTSIAAILENTGSQTDQAWHYLLNAETSCYWYWDNSENGKWDSNPTRGANQAVAHADLVVGDGSGDTIPPTIFLPQRKPYNPGGIEWGTQVQPSDFQVYSYVYDVSELADVTLHVRVDPDGKVDPDNLLYAGTWQDAVMQSSTWTSRTDPTPAYKADQYSATVTGVHDALVDYYVSATDTKGHLARSPIQHVYVGQKSGSVCSVGWSPYSPSRSDTITIRGTKAGKLHWGVNGWTLPGTAFWPPGTVAFGDGKSVESPLTGPDGQGCFTIPIGPFPAGSGVNVIDFVMHYVDNTWDNNGNNDYHITLVDNPTDAGPQDGGADAGTDAGADAGADPGQDAGTDAGVDSGTDLSNDSGLDAGADTHADGGGSDADVGPADQEDGGGGDPGKVEPKGCGCASQEGSPAGLVLFLLTLVVPMIRKRFLTRSLIALLVLLFLSACMGPVVPSGDAGSDTGDGAPPGDDGSLITDDGPGFTDDGGIDAGGDLKTDAGQDAGSDAGGDSGPVHPCGETTFSYDSSADSPQPTSVVVAGTFNSWAVTGAGSWPLADPNGTHHWVLNRVLDSGSYQYKFVLNGTLWKLDPNNPNTVTDGHGNTNSLLTVDCNSHLEVVSYSNDATSISAVLRLTPANLVLDPASVTASLDHVALDGSTWTTSGNDINLHVSGLASGIHDLRVGANSIDGKVAVPVLLKFHLGVSTDWRDDVLYFAMTDRFLDGNTANNLPVAGVVACGGGKTQCTNYWGGDFAGTTQKIQEGYFDDLGVGALWISWPVDNLNGFEAGSRPSWHKCGMSAQDAGTNAVAVNYTAYHGYWPVNLDQVEEYYGTLQELQQLVDAAHARGIRVMLDLTANHVHISSPLYQQHKDYFNFPDTGSQHICQNVGWDGVIGETCWFAPYLPDLDYSQPQVVTTTVNMAFDWIQKTGADGFRVDAVKQMNKAFLVGLRSRLKSEVELTGIPFYLVGETFTGDAGLIASYLGDTMIEGQFDFPSNWQVLKGLAKFEIGLDAMDSAVRGAKATYGTAAVMSNFIGNHDLARFLSLASPAPDNMYCGVWDTVSDSAQGWLYPPGQPSSDQGYQRLRLAFTYIMTIPGVPLIYYGDEIGMPGGGDPDNRRMMRFGADLNTREAATLAFMKKLGAARKAHPSLRTGDWRPALVAQPDVLAYPRVGAGETTVVILNRGGTTQNLSLSVGAIGVSNGAQYLDALSDSPATLTVSGGQLSISVPAATPVILVPK